jgi:hypothetical protein
MKFLLRLLSTLAVILLFMPATGFGANNQQFCTSYADNAVRQYDLGKQYQLPGIVPPAWSNDRNAHFAWCMVTPENIVNNESAKRQSYLDQHLPKQMPMATGPKVGQVTKVAGGGIVAATPISIPRPIKQGGLQVAHAIPANRIERAEMVSLDGNSMHIRFHYRTADSINNQMYGGAFLYDIDMKPVNVGYKPTGEYRGSQGEMDIFLTLPPEPFQSATLETLILHNGKVLVRQYFKMPFVWNGNQGSIVSPSVIKQAKTSGFNTQMAVGAKQSLPPMPDMKADIQKMQPRPVTSNLPVGLDPGLGP